MLWQKGQLPTRTSRFIYRLHEKDGHSQWLKYSHIQETQYSAHSVSCLLWQQTSFHPLVQAPKQSPLSMNAVYACSVVGIGNEQELCLRIPGEYALSISHLYQVQPSAQRLALTTQHIAWKINSSPRVSSFPDYDCNIARTCLIFQLFLASKRSRQKIFERCQFRHGTAQWVRARVWQLQHNIWFIHDASQY